MSLLPDFIDEFGGNDAATSTRFARRMILTEAAATIFLPAPWGFTNLRLSFVGRCDAAADYATLRMRLSAGPRQFEVDTGDNYDFEQVYGWGVTVDSVLPAFSPLIRGFQPAGSNTPLMAGQFAANYAALGAILGADSPAGYAYSGSFFIPNYSGALFYKSYQGVTDYRVGTYHYLNTIAGTWKNSAPVRGVEVSADDGDLIAGTMLMLEAS